MDPLYVVEVIDDTYCQATWIERTQDIVPVPTVSSARGQHLVARALRQAGYNSLPPYHPDYERGLR